MKPRICIGPSIVGLLLCLWGIGCSGEKASPGDSPPIKVRVMLLPATSFGPLFIAHEEGYFKEERLDVEFVHVGFSIHGVPLLADGKIDVYGGSLNVGLLNAIARGAAIRIVADKGHCEGDDDFYFTMVVRRDLVDAGSLESPADLKGARVAVTPGTTLAYYLDAVLRPASLTRRDLDCMKMSSQNRLQGIVTGGVDAVIVAEPWVTRILKTGKGVVWQPATRVLPGLQFAILAFGPRLFESDREAGRRFMRAYLRALRRYNEGKTRRNLEVLARFTELEVALLRETCWPRMHDDGHLEIDSVLDFQTWAHTKGNVDRVLGIREIYDASFVEHAARELGVPAKSGGKDPTNITGQGNVK